MKYREGLVSEICFLGRSPFVYSTVKGSSSEIVGARLPVFGGELVNRNGREEPVCLKYSEGLVFRNSRSSSSCVEGRARQRDL